VPRITKEAVELNRVANKNHTYIEQKNVRRSTPNSYLLLILPINLSQSYS
jgi:hypothetical protein